MKIVVDTNIVFSSLLNADSQIHDILFNSQGIFDFYTPEFMEGELGRYSDKISQFSKLDENRMAEAKLRLLRCVNLISENLITEFYWQEALFLTKDVDEDDTPFVALAMQLQCPLWTGDKKLIEGVKMKGFLSIVPTKYLADLKEKISH